MSTLHDSFLRRIADAIERGNKVFWYSMVFPVVFPNRTIPIQEENIERVLIIRSDAIGDMILTTPLFRALKSRHPELRLWVAASDRNAQVIDADPDIEKIIVLVKKRKIVWSAIRSLRAFKPQIIMNCVTNETTKYGMIARLISRTAFTVALGHPERAEYAALYSRLIRVPDMYTRWYADIMLEFIRQTFGISIDAKKAFPHIVIEEEHLQRADSFFKSSMLRIGEPALVNISAGQPRKRWSNEKYIALITMLRKRFDTVILTSTPEDRQNADTILRHFGAGVLYYDAENIRALAALIARCRIVVTPDTSVIHVAAAEKIPVVAMYSNAKSVVPQWLPFGVPFSAVVTEEYFCEAIDPREVFANVAELIDALPNRDGKS